MRKIGLLFILFFIFEMNAWAQTFDTGAEASYHSTTYEPVKKPITFEHRPLSMMDIGFRTFAQEGGHTVGALGLGFMLENFKFSLAVSFSGTAGREYNEVITDSNYFSGYYNSMGFFLGYAIPTIGNDVVQLFITPTIGWCMDREIYYDDGGYETYFFGDVTHKFDLGGELTASFPEAHIAVNVGTSICSPLMATVGYTF